MTITYDDLHKFLVQRAQQGHVFKLGANWPCCCPVASCASEKEGRPAEFTGTYLRFLRTESLGRRTEKVCERAFGNFVIHVDRSASIRHEITAAYALEILESVATDFRSPCPRYPGCGCTWRP